MTSESRCTPLDEPTISRGLSASGPMSAIFVPVARGSSGVSETDLF